MRFWRTIRLFMTSTIVLTALTGITQALPRVETPPDWPCVQSRQDHLSLGQVWTGPPPPDTAAVADPAIAALADRVVQRRMPLPEAEAAIAAFASGADNAQLAALMQAVFDRIDGQRTNLIAGISRYGNKQARLAAQVQARRDRMAQLQSAATPDFDAMDAEEKALDWDTRIFTDRQQSLTYVCETPVILEQRLFALGRAIASHLNP